MVKSVLIARKSDGLIFCEVSEDYANDKNLSSVRARAIEFLKSLQPKSDLCTVSLDKNSQFIFHYKIKENIVYLLVAEVKYPQKLAFCFLEELNEEFTQARKIYI